MEPILVGASRLKPLNARQSQTRLEFLEILRHRVDFFALSDLYDRVDLQTSGADQVQKIQKRHGDRLREMECAIEELKRRNDALTEANRRLLQNIGGAYK